MILATLITLGIAGLTAGLMLNWASRRFERKDDDVILRIHDLLPKTQCAQCGYPGCRPYAEAIAAGEAINRCPPGGDKTIAELANLLGREPVPLADDLAEAPVAAVAVIREPECIGCRLCIDACPVDAIIGAPRLMHTVVADLCTGCELCIEPCPVDCIDLITQPIEGTPTAPATLTMPCIHCGNCEPACPRSLAPQQLLSARESPDLAESLDLSACVECMRCDRVCPSEIPLTAIFGEMKKEASERAEARALADAADARYEAREARRSSHQKRNRHRPDDVDALLSSIGDDL